MVWKISDTHIESGAERQICFADMDKSDVLGAILPVLAEQESRC